MASYHFAMKTSACSKASATIHADYICREGRYAKGDKAVELIYKEHGNMPEWAKENPREFWQASDNHERANGTVYREMELALPNELTKDQQIELTKNFVGEHLGNEFVYSYAIHSNEARLSKNFKGNEESNAQIPVKNPHVHIMFSERRLDGIERTREQFFKRANGKNPERGGCKKDPRWYGKERIAHLTKLRASWAEMQNEYLARHGHHARTDHRSLEAQRKEAITKNDLKKAQELDRLPERHLGPKAVAQYKDPQKAAGKVKAVHLARSYRQLLKEIEACQKRLEKLRADERTPENDREIKMTIGKINGLLNDRIKAIKSGLADLRRQAREEQKKVISQERAAVIAQSVFLRGADKAADREQQEIAKEKKRLAVREQAHLQLPKPKFFNITYKKEHEAEAQQIAAQKHELSFRIAQNEHKISELEKRLQSPEAQEKLRRITEAILRKNRPQQTKAKIIEAQIESLTKEKINIMQVKANFSYKDIRKEITVKEPKASHTRANSGSGNKQSDATVQNLLNQTAKILEQLGREEKAVNMRVSLDENERGE